MDIDLLQFYDDLNKTLFSDKKLNEKFKRIEWSTKMTSTAGLCYGDGKIRLSVDYHRKHPDEIKGTIAHEMIHLYVSGHSERFYSEMNRLNQKAGYKLITRHSQERAKVGYVGICPEHKDIGTRSKKPREEAKYRCKRCGQEINWIKID